MHTVKNQHVHEKTLIFKVCLNHISISLLHSTWERWCTYRLGRGTEPLDSLACRHHQPRLPSSITSRHQFYNFSRVGLGWFCRRGNKESLLLIVLVPLSHSLIITFPFSTQHQSWSTVDGCERPAWTKVLHPLPASGDPPLLLLDALGLRSTCRQLPIGRNTFLEPLPLHPLNPSQVLLF